MIGIDPHKGSHTAVAIGAAEEPLGEAAGPRLPGPGPAAAGVGGGMAGADLGGGGRRRAGLHLLAQQLAAAGERVLDVQPKLAARVRLLAGR